MQTHIKVSYDFTSDIDLAKTWLSTISTDAIACDFEVATRYTEEERKEMEARGTLADIQALNATALDHPFHTVVTHFSFANSKDYGRVIVCDTEEIRDLVFNFLVTTHKCQIWHNASYDFKQIYFNTRQFPKTYEDTQILSKTLINHVETHKAKTGLKDIMGSFYGAWGISSDNFTLSQMHETHVIHYAAIDACATWNLWINLQERFKDE